GRAATARTSPARLCRPPLLRGPVRGGDEPGAQLLGGDRQEPDRARPGDAAPPARPRGRAQYRPRSPAMTTLTDLLREAAEDQPTDGLTDITVLTDLGRGRVQRRRVRIGIAVAAVVALVATPFAVRAVGGPD